MRQAQLELRGQQAQRVLQEIQAQQEPRVQLAHKAQQAQRELQERLVHKVQRDQRVLQAQQEI